jgi:hypothetical protein
MRTVIAQTPVGVTTDAGTAAIGILANDAHEIAGITYRQLDYWARQGWVRPTIDAGEGRSGRRQYSVADVVRLDLLKHLAVSGVNAALAGIHVATLDVGDGDVRILWGPIGSKAGEEPALAVVDAADVLSTLETGGAYVVYNPAHVRRVAAALGAAEGDSRVKRVRSA